MFSLNKKIFPFVIFEFDGQQSLDDHKQSMVDWNDLFEQKEAFIAVRVFNDSDALIHPKGAAKVTKEWLENGAAENIKTYVTAMINVIPRESYDTMKHMSVEDVFGVKGGIFCDFEELVKWLRDNTESQLDSSLDAFIAQYKSRLK